MPGRSEGGENQNEKKECIHGLLLRFPLEEEPPSHYFSQVVPRRGVFLPFPKRAGGALFFTHREKENSGMSKSVQYYFVRGSKSRNKVAVGEPSAGSFTAGRQAHHPRSGEKEEQTPGR